jgi:tetratricopeptide (TPR) repeat protein
MIGTDLDHVERELREAWHSADRSHERLAAALEAAVAATRESPGMAAEVFDLTELLGELSETYEALGRPADALEVMQQAIDAGYRSEPDPRCRFAEIHLRSGNAEEAHRIFAEVKEDTPADVWLYNNAGLEYGHAGDHVRALEWLDPGLDLAMRTGDPERLVDQLLDLRHRSLNALGRNDDDLQRRGRALLEAPPPPPRPRHVPVRSSLDELSAPATGTPPRAVAMSATAWFPAEEWSAALAAWPEIADTVGTSDHREYCHFIQQRLLESSAAQQQEGVSIPLTVAPIRLTEYRAWCIERGEDPGSGGARAAYAAERARLGSTDVVSWPPGRNQRCWCGSGRKYKQCCGRPA